MATYKNSTHTMWIVNKYFCLILVVGLLHKNILTMKCSQITVVEGSLIDCVDRYYLTDSSKSHLINYNVMEWIVGVFSGCGFVLEWCMCMIIVMIAWTIVSDAGLAETGSAWARQTRRKVGPCSNIPQTLTPGGGGKSTIDSWRIWRWWQLDMWCWQCAVEEGECCM